MNMFSLLRLQREQGMQFIECEAPYLCVLEKAEVVVLTIFIGFLGLGSSSENIKGELPFEMV